MSISIDYDAMANLSNLLERLTGHAEQTNTYITDNIHLQFGGIYGELMDTIAGGHEEGRIGVTEFFTELTQTTIPGYRDALDETMAFFQSTDTETAEDVDSAVNRFATADIQDLKDSFSHFYRAEDLPSEPFDDRRDPIDELTGAKSSYSEYVTDPSWLDVLSPATILDDVIYYVSDVCRMMGLLDAPFSIRAEMVQLAVGDWNLVRSYADHYRNVAQALAFMADNVEWAAYSTGQSWIANSSDAYQLKLGALESALRDAAFALGPLAQEYIDAAEELAALKDILVGLVTELMDAVITANVAAAAFAASAATGVGALVVGGATITVLAWVADIIIDILTQISRVKTHLQGASSFFAGFGKVSGDVTMPYLPKAPSVPSESTTAGYHHG